MADKKVIINGKVMLHGKGVKDSEDTSTSKTVCFDEVLPEGAPQTGGTLEIDRLIFESKEDYDWLVTELKNLKHIPGTVSTKEIVRFGDRPFEITKNFHNCILSGKDYEMKPEEKSAQKLKFIWGDCEEYTEYI